MTNIADKVAVLGAGLIGASWTALFLASGRRVSVHDASEEAEGKVRDFVESAWPDLQRLGLAGKGSPDALNFCESAGEAGQGSGVRSGKRSGNS